MEFKVPGLTLGGSDKKHHGGAKKRSMKKRSMKKRSTKKRSTKKRSSMRRRR